MRYWKVGLAAGACAACCAPLFLPLFAGSAFVGIGTAAAGIFMSMEAGAAVMAVGLFGLWFYWRRKKSKRKAAAACGCAPDSGCNTGNACDLPGPASAATN